MDDKEKLNSYCMQLMYLNKLKHRKLINEIEYKKIADQLRKDYK